MIRAAVIGVGAMGRNHARVYVELNRTDLVAVSDLDEVRGEAVARRYRIPTYTKHREMLVRMRPDVVSVVVPTQMHLQVAMDVIDSGASLLVEKPIASTVEEGEAIIAAAARRGVKLTVGHIERFNPAIIELRRRLADGALGRVFSIHTRRMGPFPARVRDVGVVIDLATHDLDLMRWLLGQPVERVYAETARRIHTDHEDMLAGLLRFGDGSIGVLEVNWLTPTKVRELSVTGEGGMFLVNYLTQRLHFYENCRADGEWESLGVLMGVGEGNMVRPSIDRREPLEMELASFIEAVRNDTEPLVSGADGLATLELALAVVEAGRCGESVHPRSVAASPTQVMGG